MEVKADSKDWRLVSGSDETLPVIEGSLNGVTSTPLAVNIPVLFLKYSVGRERRKFSSSPMSNATQTIFENTLACQNLIAREHVEHGGSVPFDLISFFGICRCHLTSMRLV